MERPVSEAATTPPGATESAERAYPADLEQLRAENISRNNAFLAELG